AARGHADVGVRAGIAVVARRPVRLRRGLALSGYLVARPLVALIREGGAVARGPTARAGGARVVHRAEEAVIAGGAVGLVRGGAAAVRRIAGAGDVALGQGGAEDGVRPPGGAARAGGGA